jgi:glycosyltransferase involved in cell wall biosynthesis
MKIALVHNTYQQMGGEDRVFAQERKMLEDAGHQVIAFVRSNHAAESYAGWKKMQLAAATVWSAQSRAEFKKLLGAEKPQVVHVHNTFMMISPSIYSACREAGVPVVQTLHNFRLLCPGANFFRDGKICEECLEHTVWRGVKHGCYRKSRMATATVAAMLEFHRWRKTWSDSVSCFVALSEFARGRFIAGGLPAERMLVKPNFVDPDPGPGPPMEERTYAVFVGRFSPVERMMTIFGAWERLKDRVPLFIVGGGPERAEMEAEAERRNLKQIRFLGVLPNGQTIRMIQGARFLVFPSEWYENFPVTIAEAFACQTPVICSGLGSMKEIVRDERTGLHFKAGDAASLAEKVGFAWENPGAMRVMGAEARREYLASYTAEQNYSQLMGIYEGAIRAGVPEPSRVEAAARGQEALYGISGVHS